MYIHIFASNDRYYDLPEYLPFFLGHPIYMQIIKVGQCGASIDLEVLMAVKIKITTYWNGTPQCHIPEDCY
jgi:hypothetical protein